VVRGNIAFGVGDKDMIAEPGTLVQLLAGTMHWFRYGKGGGEMISMTSREAF
jgi:quercetin dioxygenase-like cupin family protein